MRDFIPKGTGDSRFLKSVADFMARYPTYKDFAAALVAGTLPVDFNGINAEGVIETGTPLNRSTLLSYGTQEALGLTDDATPSDALMAAVAKAAEHGLKIAHGKHVGGGLYGAENPVMFSLPFEPKVLFISKPKAVLPVSTVYVMADAFLLHNLTTVPQNIDNNADDTAAAGTFMYVSEDRKTVYLYSTASASANRNASGFVYEWTAIG
jgi:hypothetical protein